MQGRESTPLLRDGSTLIPTDKYKVAYIIFVIQGLGSLLPWNAFISAADYFTDLYGATFVFFLSVIFNWASGLCYLLLMKALPSFSFVSRVLFSVACFFVVLMVIPFIEPTPHHFSEIITLIGVCITGLASAILACTVTGMAALFPPSYMAGMMSGNGVAGIVTIALRVITKASLPPTTAGKQASGKLFFILAAAVAIVCGITFVILSRLPITNYYINTQASDKKEARQTNFRVVIKKVWKEAFSVAVTLFITLSLFPGVTNLVQSSNGINVDWWPILFTALFLLFDFVGRTLPQFVKLFNPTSLLIPVVCRAVFFPLLIFCIHPHLFKSDIISCIIMSLFAITNGYCSTLAMIYGPQQVSTTEKEFTGIVLSGCLQGGIILGTHFAFLILYLVNGSIGI